MAVTGWNGERGAKRAVSWQRRISRTCSKARSNGTPPVGRMAPCGRHFCFWYSCFCEIILNIRARYAIIKKNSTTNGDFVMTVSYDKL